MFPRTSPREDISTRSVSEDPEDQSVGLRRANEMCFHFAPIFFLPLTNGHYAQMDSLLQL